MPAKIDTKFKEGFILSEENLTKIDDIIKKRFNFSGETPNISYELHRLDDALITYPSISEVVSEENSKRNKIKQLAIKCAYNNDSLRLNFEQGEPTKLNMSADDRDTALLLTADLKEYLNSEVLTKKLSYVTRLFEHRLFIVILLFVSMLPLFLAMLFLDSNLPIDLAKSTLDQKVNHIIVVLQQRENILLSPVIALTPVAILLLGIFLLLCSKFIYPTDIFYWGKEITRFDAQKRIRGNLFWSVLVALIVGIAGSYIYNKS